MQLKHILNALQEIAPLEFAESWDNVGLLVGNPELEVQRIMTCLTVTSVTLSEAIQKRANLIVTHHPIPFKPLTRITTEATTGKLLLDAIENRIAIYSPHTAWDNASRGINQQLAEMIGIQSIEPLKKFSSTANVDSMLGIGRCGTFSDSDSMSVGRLARVIESWTKHEIRCTHETHRQIKKVGIICGSGGSMLDMVAGRGCDAMLTGEATYHQCLEAKERGLVMFLIGHHASEAFAMKTLAELLETKIPQCSISFSKEEWSRF